MDAATRKKSCGRALNKRLLEEDLTDLVQEGVVRLQDYLRIKAAKEAFIRDQTASLPRCVGFIPNTFNLCFPMITGNRGTFGFGLQEPTKERLPSCWTLDKGTRAICMLMARLFRQCIQAHSSSFWTNTQKTHLQVTQLNQMCDGTWAYPVKQSSATTLDEPVVIVCSNNPRRCLS